MKAVGVRELKNRLSEYLRLVRSGEEILVTDRGEVVAELRQPSPRVALPHSALYPTLACEVPTGSAARLLDEERGEH